MDEEMQNPEPQKTLPAKWGARQSAALVWIVTPLLALGAGYPPIHAAALHLPLTPWLTPLLISLGFAALVWLLKAATPPAAAIGFLICMILAEDRQHSGLRALIVLFLLTFLATRFGRSKKESRKLAERRSGRRASQIVANLGVAALCAAMGWYPGCIAALAEAAADTVSSEMGQALGGRAWLITTLRPVPSGTNGGISVTGTVAGVVAAALVVAAGGRHHALGAGAIGIGAVGTFAAACAGLLFDSVLGATVERRGWLGNDLVNFSSTIFAALVAMGTWMLLRGGVL